MVDKYCPDCELPMPHSARSCLCGWNDPTPAAEADQRRHEHSIQSAPAARAAAQQRIKAAKDAHGEHWQRELVKTLTKELRHSALLQRRTHRKYTQQAQAQQDERKRRHSESVYGTMPNSTGGCDLIKDLANADLRKS